MNTLCICVLVACVAWQAGAASLDYETAEQPRVAQRGGLLKRGLLAKGKQTTTTTTPAPQEADYVDEEDYPAEADAVQNEPTSEAPPSSTEGKRLVGSGVRPFRSNTELLEALKRRRAQAAEAKHGGHQQQSTAAPQEPAGEPPAAAAQPAPAKTSFSGKKRFSSSASRIESANEDAPAPAAAAKPNRNRFSRPSPRSFQPEPEAEDQNNDTAQTRNARTFSRRGGN